MTEKTQHLSPVSIRDVTINDGFLGERQATIRNKTLPAIHHQMEKTGRLDAWRLDWEQGKKPVPHIFWDSDAGKWIEAVAYSLMTDPNPEYEAQVDAVIDMIEQAQQADGYLNIYYTAVEPQKRWTNLRDQHELYCAGHLMEAAVAYHQATGKDKLLNVLRRYTDLIDSLFGPKEGQKRGYPGHPEIEMALVRMYRECEDERYLALSKYFVDERGQSPHYFDLEAQARGDDPDKFWAKTYHYCQAHIPVREQKTATGHAVRACYLYSGMADVAAATNDTELLEVCRSIWDDLTQHAMYITGGLGPAHANEGFTFAYDLPNESAYAETCASISLAFWAQRMFHADPHSRYMDVLERALYNGILSGVSYEGAHFFYANPLTAYPHVNPFEHWSGIHTARHYQRSEWFECACCPPNLARFVTSLGAYFYSTDGDTLYVNLYNSNRARFRLNGNDVHLHQQTDYPWDGSIHFRLELDQPSTFRLALRIPEWCHDFQIEINGVVHNETPNRGYSFLQRQWANGDEIVLSLQMPAERIYPHPEIRHNAGAVALQRGPVVYCLEEVENGARLANVAIPSDARLHFSTNSQLFGGVGVVQGDAVRIEPVAWNAGLYQPQSKVDYSRTTFEFQAVPYSLWANREPGEMRVWLREI